MPRYHTDLASRRARTQHSRNANTNTKHDFPVGGVTKDSPPQPPIGFSYLFLLFLRFFLVFVSISLVKNKKIQALVKFYEFLTQQIECTWTILEAPDGLKKFVGGTGRFGGLLGVYNKKQCVLEALDGLKGPKGL